jgi:hypothetical protein
MDLVPTNPTSQENPMTNENENAKSVVEQVVEAGGYTNAWLPEIRSLCELHRLAAVGYEVVVGSDFTPRPKWYVWTAGMGGGRHIGGPFDRQVDALSFAVNTVLSDVEAETGSVEGRVEVAS